ncbi:phage portal protein [Vagococcus vulneris]|uniref:Phage portal protein n=1 Tax=Vagococcus vulneris TaxID=1977869 RepID=A0A429ZX68_9ENTE|nr:phage portal protein [Vagococcus vulneris]RST98269.1 phage portal protein [Vagococcus vulneris]
MAKPIFYEPPQIMTADPELEMNSDVLSQYIKLHEQELPRYQMLYKMYRGKHEIVEADAKEKYKPDNRLVSNFASYIVETFNGYFMGKRVSTSHPNDNVSNLVNNILKRNDQDDNNSTLSKYVSIFGRSYELIFQDEEANTCITYNNPLDMFIVYDNTMLQRRLFAVRYYLNSDDKTVGEIYARDRVIYFSEGKDGYDFNEEVPHFYGDVPVVEYINNDERIGLFEPVISLINGFNKALSEKSNDVDYFADAYLAILGVELDDDSSAKIRDNRIINFFGTDNATEIKNIIVKFLEKPDGDTSQEHLLDRVEKLIYQMAMVTNLNSESFGNASGVGLSFKLQEMENLALVRERKFVSSMNQRFKMIFQLPTNVPTAQRDEWFNLDFTFHRNIPRDVLSEIQAAQAAAGLLPLVDRIAMISTINDPQEVAKRMQEEMSGVIDDPFSRVQEVVEEDEQEERPNE